MLLDDFNKKMEKTHQNYPFWQKWNDLLCQYGNLMFIFLYRHMVSLMRLWELESR